MNLPSMPASEPWPLGAASDWSLLGAANGGALQAWLLLSQLSSGLFGTFRHCFKVCSFYKTIPGVICSLRMDLPEENSSEMQGSGSCLLLHFRGHLNYCCRSAKCSHNHSLKLLTSLLLLGPCASMKLLLVS